MEKKIYSQVCINVHTQARSQIRQAISDQYVSAIEDCIFYKTANLVYYRVHEKIWENVFIHMQDELDKHYE